MSKAPVTGHYYAAAIISQLLPSIEIRRSQLERTEIPQYHDNAPNHNSRVLSGKNQESEYRTVTASTVLLRYSNLQLLIISNVQNQAT